MAEFDPDAYLAGSGGTAVAEPPAAPAPFDPDAYLAIPPEATLADLMSGKFGRDVKIPPHIKVPVMSEVGAVPAPAIEGLLRYATPYGFAQQAAEKIAPESTATRIGAGVIGGASEALAGFTTPESLAALAIMPQAKVAQILLNLGFGAEAVLNLPAQITAYGATNDPEEKAKIATGITVSLALPALGVTHAALRKPKSAAAQKPAVPEVFDPDVYLRERPAAEEMTSETARVAPEAARMEDGGLRMADTSSTPTKAESAGASVAAASNPPVATEPGKRSILPEKVAESQRAQSSEMEPRGSSRPETTTPENLRQSAKSADELPARRRTAPIAGPGGFTEAPLVQFIRDDLGGVLSRSSARDKWGVSKYEENASLWDDAPQLRNPRHNQIYNARTGVAPDEAATAAADAGLLPQGATATDLWAALQRESDAAHALAGGVVAQRANQQTAMTQDRAFAAAIEQPIRGEKPITVADLNVGDTVRIGTERMKVTGMDPDTYDVTLEDGSKFGIQHIQDNQALYGEIQRPSPETAIWLEQEKVAPFGFGPGAASAEEVLSSSSQIRQLTETVSESLKTTRPVSIAQRWARVTAKIGGKAVSARESLGRAMETTKAMWLTVKNGYLRPSLFTEPKEVVKDWDFTDQKAGFEARQMALKLRGRVDPLTDRAMTYWIQAGGDPAVLRQRAAASNIKYRPAYETALNLSPEQRAFAMNAGQYFEGMLQDGVSSGLLDHGLDNYVNQIWKRPNKFTQKLQADLQMGKLQTSFQFAKQRIFGSYFDGEQAGYAPADTRLSTLIPVYDQAFRKALNARAMIKGLREANLPDGEPAVKFSGMTQPIMAKLEDGRPNSEVPPQAYLVRSRALPENAVTKDGRPYRPIDHPALRGWKMVIDDAQGARTFHQVDMLVHPDFAQQLKNLLGRSWFRKNPVTHVMLKAGALAKQTKLSLSIFHLDQEGLHGLFHRVNPANLERINFDDPAQTRLIRNGLVVSNFEAMELFSEGLRGGGLVSHVPVLGELQNRFNEFLFKDYIPRLKMTMALHAFERNVKRYPKLSPDVVAELTANQGNAAFGELNYRQMGRSPHLQDFLRLTVLAPDFLEARGRFVAQALKPYGREQQVALMLGAATMYVAGRALNQWLDNDPHWTKPFSVIYNGREYRLRTVMGDAAEVFLDPRRFFYYRFSPWLKTIATVHTERDYRGVKLSNWEQVKDTLSWFVPMPLAPQEGASVLQRALGTAGVHNKPAPTAVNDIYDMAREFRDKLARTNPKMAAEIDRARKQTLAESDYGKLNRALIGKDSARAAEEIRELIKTKGKTVDNIVEYYSALPARPVTRSTVLEEMFLKQMSEEQRARYGMARNERIGMTQRFFQALQTARPAGK